AFPENALLAVAGRMDVPSMMEFVGEFLGDDARKALRDSLEHRAGPAAKVVRDLLLAVGPDYGFCVMAPPPDDRAWAPQMFSAVRVRPGPDGKPIEQTLWGALNFFAGLAVLDWNGKHEDKLDLKTVLQDKTEVKYFLNDKQFPPGVQPAFA